MTCALRNRVVSFSELRQARILRSISEQLEYEIAEAIIAWLAARVRVADGREIGGVA